MNLIGKTKGIDSLHSVEQINKIIRTEEVACWGIAAVCDSFCLETAEAAFLLRAVGKEQLLIDKECLLTDQTARGGPELLLNCA